MSNPTLLATWRQRWNRNLLRFLGHRVRTAADIEDLAQETYLRLLRAPDLREIRNPEAYMIRVASHVISEWRSSQPPSEALTPIEDNETATDQPPPEFVVEARIAQKRIDQVLSTCSPMMRAVLLLRLRDDRACKHIAKTLGLTDRQVKRYLAKGYDRLQQALEVG